jgi:multicomponent Na+:H+ antiporter subunit E
MLSVTLLPEHAWRWRIRGAARLLGYFLWQSAIGGVDVAWRALHPRLPLAPGWYQYPLRLAPGPAQTCFINMVSLLPGTLSATLQESQLTLHVVDSSQPILAQTQRLEVRVASLFDVPLSSETSRRT